MIGVFVGVMGVAFVVRTLISRSEEVIGAWKALEPPRLVLALLLGACAMAWIGRAWSALLAEDDGPAPGWTTMSWYFTGQLGKYVPGGIWAVVGRSEMAVRGGVNRNTAYSATALSMGSTYLAAALVGGLGSILSWTYPLAGVAALGAAASSLVVVAVPRARGVAVRILPGLGRLSLSSRSLARRIATHLPAWILVSLATSVVAGAFNADIGIIHMLCAAPLSWLVGFVVIGAPGGIGIREATFTMLVAPSVTTGVGLSVALASRIVFIVVDVTTALISSYMARRHSRIIVTSD